MAIQWNHTKCCGTDPCCHGNEIWARRGDPIAYRLVWMFANTVTAELLEITIMTTLSEHVYAVVEREAKFENGYIWVGVR